MSESLLSERHLNNLESYKYSSVDKSPLTKYVMRHYWDLWASFFPPWIAPNLITLIGLGFVVFNVLCIAFFVPDLDGPGPRWIYYSFALGLHLYQTFDNVDGRQARKTGQSSALGELFDHGVDTINCPLGGIVQAAAMMLGGNGPSARRGAAMVILCCWPMWFSTWEEYHTGTLYLGPINGPTEGLLLAQVAMLASGVFGPKIWRRPVSEVSGILANFVPSSYNMDDLFVVFTFLALIFAHAPVCLMNVYASLQKKGTSFADAYLQITPMLLFSASASLWILSPYSILLDRGLVIPWALLCASVFGRLGTEIILAHLVKARYPWGVASIGMFSLMFGCLMVNAPYLGLPRMASANLEILYLFFALIVSLYAYCDWALRVIRALTGHLGIQCLTIPHGAGSKNLAYATTASAASQNGSGLDLSSRGRSD